MIEDEAKSLGHARAIFFAAPKRGFGPDDSCDIIRFAGLETYAILVDGNVRAFFGGKIIRPEDYDNAVRNKLLMAAGQEGYEKARVYIRGELSDLSKTELNSTAVYEVYEKLKDHVRRTTFLKEKRDGKQCRWINSHYCR